MVVVDGLIVRAIPGPVGRIVLKAEKEGTASLPHDETNCAVRKQVCEISLVFGRFEIFIQVEPAGSVLVRKVIGPGSVDTVELVEAVTIRAEFGEVPQMPFADQGGFVTGGLEQRSDCRMLRRYSDLHVCVAQRLFEAHRQAMRVTSGNVRGACWGAHGRRCVVIRELQSLLCKIVKNWGFVFRASIAAQVAISKIVGQDE